MDTAQKPIQMISAQASCTLYLAIGNRLGLIKQMYLDTGMVAEYQTALNDLMHLCREMGIRDQIIY